MKGSLRVSPLITISGTNGKSCSNFDASSHPASVSAVQVSAKVPQLTNKGTSGEQCVAPQTKKPPSHDRICPCHLKSPKQSTKKHTNRISTIREHVFLHLDIITTTNNNALFTPPQYISKACTSNWPKPPTLSQPNYITPSPPASRTSRTYILHAGLRRTRGVRLYAQPRNPAPDPRDRRQLQF